MSPFSALRVRTRCRTPLGRRVPSELALPPSRRFRRMLEVFVEMQRVSSFIARARSRRPSQSSTEAIATSPPRNCLRDCGVPLKHRISSASRAFDRRWLGSNAAFISAKPVSPPGAWSDFRAVSRQSAGDLHQAACVARDDRSTSAFSIASILLSSMPAEISGYFTENVPPNPQQTSAFGISTNSTPVTLFRRRRGSSRIPDLAIRDTRRAMSPSYGRRADVLDPDHID